MKKDIAKKFVAALRSGKYEQTTGMLYDPHHNCFCALGVLCSLAGKDGIEKSFNDSIHIPDSVADWSGLSYDGASDIMRLNDTNKFTFNQIADFVEAMYIKSETPS